MNDLPSIGAVISYYGTDVPRSSGKCAVRCPFHDDKHASAGIDFSNNLFNCLACGVGGNSLQIIAQREGINIREALTFAEGIAGESHRELSGERELGSGLPRKSWHNKRGGTPGAIRRSREP